MAAALPVMYITAVSTCLTFWEPFLLPAGKYSEHAFQALDYILDEASKHGVRLLLTLVNNWDNADSKTQVQLTALSSLYAFLQMHKTGSMALLPYVYHGQFMTTVAMSIVCCC